MESADSRFHDDFRHQIRRIDIKPIPTIYNGIKYRSRLEARWAFFFDSIGFEYVYEPEGIEWQGTRYLVDFWLPVVKMFAEVKPTWITDEEDRKIKTLVMYSGKPCLVLDGYPDFRQYKAIQQLDLDGEKDWYICRYILDPWYYFLEKRFFSDPPEHAYSSSEDFSVDYQDAVCAARIEQFGGGNG